MLLFRRCSESVPVHELVSTKLKNDSKFQAQMALELSSSKAGCHIHQTHNNSSAGFY